MPAGHAFVGPLERLFRRRSEHGKEPDSICAVLIYQRLWVDGVALGFRHLGAIFQHHALAQQALEGFVAGDQPLIAHQLVEKARVEQVENGVFDSAHVLIDRQPVVGCRFIQHARCVVRAGETGVVPGRLHKGIEGVGFPLQLFAIERVFAPLRVRLDRRVHTVHFHLFGQ